MDSSIQQLFILYPKHNFQFAIFNLQFHLIINSRNAQRIPIVFLKRKVSKIDVGIGDKAGEENDRVDQKTGLEGQGGEKRDQEEPVDEVMGNMEYAGETSQVDPFTFRSLLDLREPRRGVIFQDQSK